MKYFEGFNDGLKPNTEIALISFKEDKMVNLLTFLNISRIFFGQ